MLLTGGAECDAGRVGETSVPGGDRGNAQGSHELAVPVARRQAALSADAAVHTAAGDCVRRRAQAAHAHQLPHALRVHHGPARALPTHQERA